METTSHRLARSSDALETWTCSECGARNRSSAEWCGQCYSLPPGAGRDRTSEVPAGSGPEDEVTDLAVGGPGMVAVGLEATDDGSRAAVWTSTDGTKWARVADQASSSP